MTRGPVRAGELVGKRLGKYEILALIAVGGTAEIYLARIGGEAGFEKYLVVKCLLDHLADNQEFVRMFLDEARLGAQLDHSNIVQTLELGQHDSRYYMVMEYLAGMSLAQLARKTQERVPGGLLPVDLVLGMAAQACAGLSYAHSKSIDGKDINLVHRDVSPQNLVVTFEGVLKIVDFGIAKSDVRQSQTRTGTIKGKFAYMSPEQCLSKPIDQRTDIFALGTICHELLTGRRLFKRQSTYETYQAIVNGQVPRPSQVNPKLDQRLDELIMKALEYEKEKRYTNAEAFGEALLSTLHARGTAVGAGDVARYIEEHFSDELDAHGERMRELISGARAEARPNTWDEDFLEGSASQASQSVSLSAVEPPSADGDGMTRDLGPLADEGATRVSAEARDDDADDDDDDEGPTRVEFNPGDRVADLHRAATADVHRKPTVDADRLDDSGELVLRETPAAEPDPGATNEMKARRPAVARGRPPRHATAKPTAGRAPTRTPVPSLNPGSGRLDPARSSPKQLTPLPRLPSEASVPASAAQPDDFATPPDTLEPGEPGEFPLRNGPDEPLLGASLPADAPGSWPPRSAAPSPGAPLDYPRATGFDPASGVGSWPGTPSVARPATRSGAADSPLWLIAAVFVAFAGLGLGATLLVAQLFA